ncbi:DUF5343 domain-containing protein [Steroidobacter denitrificans]|uniref:DUF5343 domain-containing protein n=1 Tax=Steroidobacter denitrificans TaxID=465721 RepID=UPI00143BA13D
MTPDGKPTQRYNDYRDHSRSQIVLGDALRDAYGDIFLIKEHPAAADRSSITGKFKSFCGEWSVGTAAGTPGETFPVHPS